MEKVFIPVLASKEPPPDGLWRNCLMNGEPMLLHYNSNLNVFYSSSDKSIFYKAEDVEWLKLAENKTIQYKVIYHSELLEGSFESVLNPLGSEGCKIISIDAYTRISSTTDREPYQAYRIFMQREKYL